MYKLLIVDDEIATVNGMAYDINWTEVSVDEVFIAYSAEEALNLLSKTRIDVVLADICMPEMDGLEMASRIQRLWPYSKVIFVSGYDEFDFAQQAIVLGAYGYILKPVEDAEVKRIVGNAIKDINNELIKTETLEKAKKQMEDAIPVLQEKFMNSWIVQGRTDPKKEPEKWDSLQMALSLQNPISIIMVRIDNWGIKIKIEEREKYKIAIRNLILAILLKDVQSICFEDYDENLLLIVQKSSQNELEDYCLYMESMAEFLQNTVNTSLGCILSLFFGPISCYTEHLPNMYRDVLNLARRSLVWDEGIIIRNEIMSADKGYVQTNIGFNHSNLTLLIESLKKDNALEMIEDAFRMLETCEPLYCEWFLEIYYTVCGVLTSSVVRRGLSLRDLSNNEEVYFFNFEQFKSVKDLKCWCLSTISSYIEYIKENGETQINTLVTQTKKLIGERLEQGISVSDIAACIYVNPDYLSRLFRRITGVSITDYVIKEKIEKAKDLLRQPGMKIYMVAESIGYESVSHFSRIFKREVGMAPKEYQRMDDNQ